MPQTDPLEALRQDVAAPTNSLLNKQFQQPTLSATMAAPLVRAAEAIQRMNRVAEEMERVATTLEKQLSAIKPAI